MAETRTSNWAALITDRAATFRFESPRTEPSRTLPLPAASFVAAGHNFTMIVAGSERAVYSAGSNELDQLGRTNPADRMELGPVMLPDIPGLISPGPLTNIYAVAAGKDFALFGDAEYGQYLWASGSNQFGQYGYSSYKPKNQGPVAWIYGIPGLVGFDAGEEHSMGADPESGEVYVAGNNKDSRLAQNRPPNEIPYFKALFIPGLNCR